MAIPPPRSPYRLPAWLRVCPSISNRRCHRNTIVHVFTPFTYNQVVVIVRTTILIPSGKIAYKRTPKSLRKFLTSVLLTKSPKRLGIQVQMPHHGITTWRKLERANAKVSATPTPTNILNGPTRKMCFCSKILFPPRSG